MLSLPVSCSPFGQCRCWSHLVYAKHFINWRNWLWVLLEKDWKLKIEIVNLGGKKSFNFYRLPPAYQTSYFASSTLIDMTTSVWSIVCFFCEQVGILKKNLKYRCHCYIGNTSVNHLQTQRSRLVWTWCCCCSVILYGRDCGLMRKMNRP